MIDEISIKVIKLFDYRLINECFFEHGGGRTNQIQDHLFGRPVGGQILHY